MLQYYVWFKSQLAHFFPLPLPPFLPFPFLPFPFLPFPFLPLCFFSSATSSLRSGYPYFSMAASNSSAETSPDLSVSTCLKASATSFLQPFLSLTSISLARCLRAARTSLRLH